MRSALVGLACTALLAEGADAQSACPPQGLALEVPGGTLGGPISLALVGSPGAGGIVAVSSQAGATPSPFGTLCFDVAGTLALVAFTLDAAGEAELAGSLGVSSGALDATTTTIAAIADVVHLPELQQLAVLHVDGSVGRVDEETSAHVGAFFADLQMAAPTRLGVNDDGDLLVMDPGLPPSPFGGAATGRLVALHPGVLGALPPALSGLDLATDAPLVAAPVPLNTTATSFRMRAGPAPSGHALLVLGAGTGELYALFPPTLSVGLVATLPWAEHQGPFVLRNSTLREAYVISGNSGLHVVPTDPAAPPVAYLHLPTPGIGPARIVFN